MKKMDSLSDEEKSIRKSRIIGSIVSVIAIILFSMYLFQDAGAHYSRLLLYSSIALLLIGVLLILPINYFIFDVKDWEPNKDARALVKKLRLRALVFTNLSILILIIAIFVIIFSFYQLTHPSLQLLKEKFTTVRALKSLRENISSKICNSGKRKLAGFNF